MTYKKNRFINVILLTIVGGYLNAYTFLLKDGVFASMQTGNIIFSSISLINQDYLEFFRYLVPITVYSLSIMAAIYLKKNIKKYIKYILLIEILTLFILSFINNPNYNIFFNSTVAFVSALQIEGLSNIAGSSYTTTMCTNNLRLLSQEIANSISNRNITKNTWKFLSIIIFFSLGVMLATSIININIINPLYIPILILILVLNLKKNDI